MQGIQQAPCNTSAKATIKHIFADSFEIKRAFSNLLLPIFQLNTLFVPWIEDQEHRGHSIITLSQNAQNLEHPFHLVRTCPILGTPSLHHFLNVQNLTPTPSPTTSTTTPHKNSKFCDFVNFVSVPVNTTEKCFLNVTQVHLDTNGINHKGWLQNFTSNINQI